MIQESNGKTGEGFVTKKELAVRLHKTPRTIENWQKRGVIPYVKIGRSVLFHWPDVVARIKSRFGR